MVPRGWAWGWKGVGAGFLAALLLPLPPRLLDASRLYTNRLPIPIRIIASPTRARFRALLRLSLGPRPSPSERLELIYERARPPRFASYLHFTRSLVFYFFLFFYFTFFSFLFPDHFSSSPMVSHLGLMARVVLLVSARWGWKARGRELGVPDAMRFWEDLRLGRTSGREECRS